MAQQPDPLGPGRLARGTWLAPFEIGPAQGGSAGFDREESTVKTRVAGIGFALLAAAALDAGTAEAQISGRVVLREGPIAIDVAFGRPPAVVIAPRRAPRGRVVVDRVPARYEPGMSIVGLERYMRWVEVEYRTYRRMHEDEAWYRLGWNERQLDDYVDWLKDERKYLKREHKHLRRLIRDRGRYGPGYGEWRGEWDDDDWDDDDWDDWDDDWDDRDDDDRGRRGRGRGRGR